MDLLALGAELPLQMTADGQPALPCPLHGCLIPLSIGADHDVVGNRNSFTGLSRSDLHHCGNVTAKCPQGCASEDVLAVWAEQSPMLKEWLMPDLGVLSELPEIKEAPPAGVTDGASTEGSKGEHGQNSETLPARQAPELSQWKNLLYFRGIDVAERTIREHQDGRALIEAMPLETWLATLQTLRLHPNPNDHLTYDPALSVTELTEETESVARALIKKYGGVVLNGNGAAPTRALSIVVEDAAQAELSNAEYLSHPAIIGRLYYTHHASVHVGGKHEGKTTMTKTEALAVATGGIKLYGREVMQTPVVYAASEDEYPSVRMDLLHMGWDKTVPLTMVKIANNGDRDFVLEDIAKEALRLGSSFVILDMLFDFTHVQDEIAYAETREAMGKVVDLAVAIKGHVKATHHAPKWFPTAEAASKAVLGSQGVVARFSPVLLSRMWVPPTDDDPGLFTVESTMTRDPRGLAIPPTVVRRDKWGWIQAEQAFDSSMKWPIYKQRIIDLMKMGEPGKRWTVFAVAQELGIARPEAQNAMMHMTQGDNAPLERMKKMGQGGGYTYQLVGMNTLAIE